MFSQIEKCTSRDGTHFANDPNISKPIFYLSKARFIFY